MKRNLVITLTLFGMLMMLVVLAGLVSLPVSAKQPIKLASQLVHQRHEPAAAITETIVFLPYVAKRWPPLPDTPVLQPISNADQDGSYYVRWDTAALAQTYELQEDSGPAFPSPETRYTGSSRSKYISGQPPGTWYYRVRACNSYGCSAWSRTQSTIVRPPLAQAYVDNDTGGQLCFEVKGTGIGQKCFPGGEHFYGEFPVGTYEYCGSASCGSICKTIYFSRGKNTIRFWCGANALDGSLTE